jgi:hypothetical protein
VASNQDLIVATLVAEETAAGGTPSAGTKYTLCNLKGDYAEMGVSGGTGAGAGEYWLKNTQGVWSIACKGDSYNPATQASSLGFPQVRQLLLLK